YFTSSTPFSPRSVPKKTTHLVFSSGILMLRSVGSFRCHLTVFPHRLSATILFTAAPFQETAQNRHTCRGGIIPKYFSTPSHARFGAWEGKGEGSIPEPEQRLDAHPPFRVVTSFTFQHCNAACPTPC